MLDLKSRTKKYQEERSLSELLPWLCEFGDNLTLDKDGAMLACYELEGVDAEGRTQIDIDTYARQAELGFREMGAQATVWSIAHRRKTKVYLDGAHFTDSISQFVDAEWKEALEESQQYENKHYVCLLLSPNTGTYGYFDRVGQLQKQGLTMPKALIEAARSMLDKNSSFLYEAEQLQSSVEVMNRYLGMLETGLAEFNINRLKGDALRRFLHDCCSPASEGQDVKSSRVSTYLDTYLADNQLSVFKDALHFSHVGDRWVAALSIKDWPAATMPGAIDSILSIPGEITVSQIFRFVDDSEAEAFITKAEKHHRSQVKSLTTLVREQFTKQESDQVNTGKLELADDAGDALRELTAERKRYGYFNLTVLCYGDTRTELEECVQMTAQALKNCQYISIRERTHLQSAWAGTIPGQWGALVRWHFVNTANLADLAQFRTFLTGPRQNNHLTEEMGSHHPSVTVLPTELATPYFFNFHVGDLGHSFVIGPSGNGKSVFTNFLVSQFRKYPKSNVYIFDKDYSCLIPTTLQGGRFIDLLGSNNFELRLNPLRFLDSEKNWAWIKSWVEILLSFRNIELTSDDDELIWEAIKRTADLPRTQWRLLTLVDFLDERLAKELRIWVEGGQYARYFDNVDDDFQLSDFVAIEMGGLFDTPTLAVAFLEYAFYSILLRLDGTPTLIEIEEFRFMLTFPHFVKKIQDWLTTFRKKNALVVFATQSLDELAKSTIFATIIDNMPTRIYLPNPNALAHYNLYKSSFGLNDEQIERIRLGIPKRNYYIVQPNRSRMIDCVFPKSILAVMRSSADAINRFWKHQKSGNPDWKINYIEEICDA
ncbi:type IV secretion system protein VirB4 [Chromobacterium haemolyticum]|uniref:Type IV secretion system protein VirB4 n=1 Tax=Chromobacterium fluminis TaxID=3044269 RepID=A0ABX0LAY4_9NEIS|nr:ATP-binding protein [Chromobacterium haemolyticum]NHR04532.1 type IV secretion system protein VirB4 [Chromobacterium haemolyticum]